MSNIEYGFKAFVAALLILGAVVFYRTRHPSTTLAADGSDPAWDAAAGNSDGVRRPTLVLFTADWCPTCRLLHDNVLSRGDVQEELRGHYRFYKVDLTDPTPAANARAQKLGVSGIPAMIRYDADGKETDRVNYLDPARMIRWLKEGE
jgi:thiol:disulfide interchange protein